MKTTEPSFNPQEAGRGQEAQREALMQQASILLRHVRPELITLAESLYPTEQRRAYHNFRHSLEVAVAAVQLIQERHIDTSKLDMEALATGILFHDVLDGPEIASAAFVRFTLEHQMGWSRERAQRVYDIVMATSRGGISETIEEKIVKAADLCSVVAPFGRFSDVAHALRVELSQRLGRPVDPLEWVVSAFRHLRGFLVPFIELTPLARDARGASAWHTATLANLLRKWEEIFPSGLIIGEVLDEGSVPMFKALPPKAMYIAFADNQEHRLEVASMLERSEQPQTASFIVPGGGSALPIAANVFDIMVVPEHIAARASSELSRVLKVGGELRIV